VRGELADDLRLIAHDGCSVFTRFSSSRMLPGQVYSIMRLMASSLNGRADACHNKRLYLFKKEIKEDGNLFATARAAAECECSPRSGDRNRSSRKVPCETARSSGLVGCGHQHARQLRYRALPPQASEFAILQDVQQLGLQRRMHLTDLVEEYGATIGDIEFAQLLPVGTGECALLIAEEFAL